MTTRILQTPGTTTTVQAPTIELCRCAQLGRRHRRLSLRLRQSASSTGPVDALAHAFGTRAATTGFAVASVLLGCAVGAFVAGNHCRPSWPAADDAPERGSTSSSAPSAPGSPARRASSSPRGWSAGSRSGPRACWHPMYISEVAPAHVRGRLGSLQQMAIVLGLFGAFLSNDILVRLAGGAGATLWLGAPAWRWIVLDGGPVPSISFLAGVLLISRVTPLPGCPGQAERRPRDFRSDRGRRGSIGSAGGGKPAGRAPAALVGPDRAGYTSVRPGRLGRHRLAAFQQFVGINIIFYYGEVLWKAAGATEQWALRINLLTGLVNILATIPAIALIDRAEPQNRCCSWARPAWR